MSAHCHDHRCDQKQTPPSGGFRCALWIALVVNLAMFLIEIGAGWQSRSVSLLADAIDFAGDAANYAVSLVVLGMAATWRSRTALWKGWTMIAFGIVVAGKALWNVIEGAVPEAMTMGIVGVLALAANVGVALLLYAYRNGDANMRSVWLCTRNDALGNVAVLIAAMGVFGQVHCGRMYWSLRSWRRLRCNQACYSCGRRAANLQTARARKTERRS
jgi:Co/Zn/Cd efflux system component